MRAQHRRTQPHFRTQRHTYGASVKALSGDLSLPDPSPGGVDVRAHPDVVSIQYSGGAERAGMAGAANGPGGIEYRQQGNCFVWIEDYQEAQKLLNQQLEMNWTELLNGFAGQLNPLHDSIFKQFPVSYYWTAYQTEWATDIVFREADFLKRLMPLLVRHGMLSFSSADVMRYFGRKVNQSGVIPANFNGSLETDLQRRQEGERVKYRMNGNSAKFYDKAYSEIGSVLRGAETTINTVVDFRAYRPKEGGSEGELQWRPLRKGIADLHRRAEVSQKANDRLLSALAAVDDSRSVEELTAAIQKHTQWKARCGNSRRVRGLNPWGQDQELFVAVNHGEFLINGFRNRDLQ